jgi:hypothetical protein
VSGAKLHQTLESSDVCVALLAGQDQQLLTVSRVLAQRLHLREIDALNACRQAAQQLLAVGQQQEQQQQQQQQQQHGLPLTPQQEQQQTQQPQLQQQRQLKPSMDLQRELQPQPQPLLQVQQQQQQRQLTQRKLASINQGARYALSMCPGRNC